MEGLGLPRRSREDHLGDKLAHPVVDNNHPGSIAGVHKAVELRLDKGECPVQEIASCSGVGIHPGSSGDIRRGDFADIPAEELGDRPAVYRAVGVRSEEQMVAETRRCAAGVAAQGPVADTAERAARVLPAETGSAQVWAGRSEDPTPRRHLVGKEEIVGTSQGGKGPGRDQAAWGFRTVEVRQAPTALRERDKSQISPGQLEAQAKGESAQVCTPETRWEVMERRFREVQVWTLGTLESEKRREAGTQLPARGSWVQESMVASIYCPIQVGTQECPHPTVEPTHRGHVMAEAGLLAG